MNVDSSDFAAELARLKSAQRRNHLMLVLVFLLFLGVLGFVLFERQRVQGEPIDSISAQRFALLNQKGEVIAMLSKGRQGPLLMISDERARVELRAAEKGSSMSISDAA